MCIYILNIYILNIYILIDILDNIKYQKYVCVYIYNKLNLGNNNILKLASVYIYIILCIYIYMYAYHTTWGISPATNLSQYYILHAL